jgi:excisionase family DNA binding protein
VTAIEFDAELAARAMVNLAQTAHARELHGDGTRLMFEPADVIYVNAGATRPADALLKDKRLLIGVFWERTANESGAGIVSLARQQPDAGIAAILNRGGKRTGKGNTWTESRVRSHRSAHRIAVYRDGEMAERGELTLEQTAQHLKVSKMTVLRLIGSGVIRARQVCKGAPWAIPEAELAGLAFSRSSHAVATKAGSSGRAPWRSSD